MGSILYDFLNDSFLLDPTLIEKHYSPLSEKEIRFELDRYREYCLTHINELLVEVGGEPTSLRLFAGKPFQRIDSLKQAAFYLDSVVLPDPLFSLTEKSSELGQAMAQFLNMPKTEHINRKELADATSLIIQLRPMVAANYVRFFPVTFFSEPPVQIPIRYSPTQFAELLPPPILEHYRHAAKATSITRSDDGWLVQNKLHLGRGIAIQFEGDSSEQLYIYNLFEQKILHADDESRIIDFQLSLPDAPPSPEQFATWLTQSINGAAHRHFEGLTRDIALAAKCNAMYLTNSAFSANLLDSYTDATNSLHTDTTRFVLNMELPFLKNVTVEDLMRARGDDGEAFELFRREVEKQFRELRLERDPQRLKIKLENATHELAEVQVTKVAQTVKRLRKKLAADVTLAVAGLAGTVATSGLSLLATVVAAGHGYKTVAEYQKCVGENPAYFLWKVKRRASRRVN